MKSTISKFSNERLESEIANLYFQAAKEAPGVTLQERGLLAGLWEEFDTRLAAGGISPDTDWSERSEWE